MAELRPEFRQFCEDIVVNNVILIQAHVRGYLVRKWMQEVKQAYKKLAVELEINPLIGVTWHSSCLCVPQIYRKSKLTEDAPKSSFTKKNREPVLKHAPSKPVLQDRSSNESPRIDAEIQTSKSLLIVTDDSKGKTDEVPLLSSNSVETQTSLLESSVSASSEIHEPVCNFLDDIDTTWKDRVVPFIHNANKAVTGYARDNGLFKGNSSDKGDDLKLDLVSSEEDTHSSVRSKQSQRSERTDRSDRSRSSTHRKETSCTEKDQPVKLDRNTDLKLDRILVKSSRSEQSDSCEIQETLRFEPGQSEPEGQRSSRSDQSERSSRFQQLTRSEGKNANGYDNKFVTKDMLDRSPRSDRSIQSHKKCHRTENEEGCRSDRAESSRSSKYHRSEDLYKVPDRDDEPYQRSKRSEYAENERGQKSSRSERQESSRSQGSDGERSQRSDGERSQRSEGERSQRSESGKSHKSEGDRGQRLARLEDEKKQRSQHFSSPRNERSLSSDRRKYDVAEPSRPAEPNKDQRSSRSNGSNSDRSERSNKSAGSRGQSSDNRHYERNIPPSLRSASPAEHHSGIKRNNGDSCHDNRGRPPGQHDSTSLTNVTSVWGSYVSNSETHNFESSATLPQDVDKLKDLRKNVAMELLWVQQAIDSRKNYLRLKGQM